MDTFGAVKALADPWPRQAGLAALVEDGAWTPLADRAVQDIRSADEYGVVRFAGRTVRWSGGEDAVRVGDLVCSEEEPGRWIGRAPALYRINRAIALPPGMYGAHAAEFLLPPGIPEPAGDRGHIWLRPDTAP